MLCATLLRLRPAPVATRRSALSTYSSGGKGWMESYPWVNLMVGFGFGYVGTVFVERNVLKPKQAALR